LTELYPEDILLLRESRTNLRKEFMWLHHYHHGDTESITVELDKWVEELRQTHEKFTAMYSRFIEHVILQQILQFNSQVTDIVAAVNFVAAAVKSVGRRPSAEHLAKLTSGVDATILDISENIKKIPCSATGETSLVPEELLEYGSTTLLHVMQQCQALAAKMITMNKRIADKDDADADA
jgi:predicted RNA-binding protein with EMAP domain